MQTIEQKSARSHPHKHRRTQVHFRKQIRKSCDAVQVTHIFTTTPTNIYADVCVRVSDTIRSFFG